MSKFIQKSFFVLKVRVFNKIAGSFRKLYYSFSGMKVGKNTVLPKLYVTWPHQVVIGNNCSLERGIYFKYDGIWKNESSIVIGNDVFIGEGCEFNISKHIQIGDRCLIASGCRFIDHDHGIAGMQPIRGQLCVEKNITIENDVWIGCNVVILKGITIGTGAVVAAGAVVTKSILPYEIWAGVPARKISERK